MHQLAEALGLTLPHAALAPSGQPVWVDMAARSADALVALATKGRTTADVLTPASLTNAMTVHAAYQQFEEDLKGTLEVGKQADLVVLSRDPLGMDPADLLDLEVVATYSKGQRIYGTH